MRPQKNLCWLFVVAVVAAVAGYGFQVAKSYRAEGEYERRFNELQTCGRNLTRLYFAAEMYSADHDGEFPVHLDDLTPTYLSTLPQCPAGSSSYGYRYSGSEKEEVLIYCVGDAHYSINESPGYPQYGTGFNSGPQLSTNPKSAMNAMEFQLR